MTAKIGIMQGRLVPKYQNRYQAFPIDTWVSEFYIADSLGFSSIEFILDHNEYEKNPLMTTEGIKTIQKHINRTGVKVRSICADYFMEAPFHSEHQLDSERVLKQLIEQAALLGVRDIVIPCVDHSSLKTDQDKTKFRESLLRCLPYAEKNEVLLNLETDLAPSPFSELLEKLNHPSVRVNYDSGNSASLGFEMEEEFDAYGVLISDLHIKDRLKNGGSVELGTGAVKFEQLFDSLNYISFSGTIIMQASRQDTYLDDLVGVQRQLKFIQDHLRTSP